MKVSYRKVSAPVFSEVIRTYPLVTGRFEYINRRNRAGRYSRTTIHEVREIIGTKCISEDYPVGIIARSPGSKESRYFVLVKIEEEGS